MVERQNTTPDRLNLNFDVIEAINATTMYIGENTRGTSPLGVNELFYFIYKRPKLSEFAGTIPCNPREAAFLVVDTLTTLTDLFIVRSAIRGENIPNKRLLITSGVIIQKSEAINIMGTEYVINCYGEESSTNRI